MKPKTANFESSSCSKNFHTEECCDNDAFTEAKIRHLSFWLESDKTLTYEIYHESEQVRLIIS